MCVRMEFWYLIIFYYIYYEWFHHVKNWIKIFKWVGNSCVMNPSNIYIWMSLMYGWWIHQVYSLNIYDLFTRLLSWWSSCRDLYHTYIDNLFQKKRHKRSFDSFALLNTKGRKAFIELSILNNSLMCFMKFNQQNNLFVL